jgi:hypothetical protein
MSSETISVPLDGRCRMRVAVHARAGDWAVTTHVGILGPHPESRAVTHVPSGLRVPAVLTESEARVLIEALAAEPEAFQAEWRKAPWGTKGAHLRIGRWAVQRAQDLLTEALCA